MPDVIYLNGRRVEEAQAVVSVHDRGFLFGDAVYEVLRALGGRVWAGERHFRRLARSLSEVEIEGVDLVVLRGLAEKAGRESGYSEALIYIQITRGVEVRNLAYGADLTPTIFVHVREAAMASGAMCAEGVAAITTSDLRWRRCDIKSTNLMGNVLARVAARKAGAYEAIMYDEEGMITEAAARSVFGVEGGELFTAPLDHAILPSVTREIVLEIAEELKISVHVERVARERFAGMEEIFVSSTMHEVCPVVKLDGEVVGDGKVGTVTRRIWGRFRERMASGED